MRSQRLRLTLRTTMIVVAILGTVMGVLIERHTRFQRLAVYHAARGSHGPFYFSPGDVKSLWEARMKLWHVELGDKYAMAASQPWAPVTEDVAPPQVEPWPVGPRSELNSSKTTVEEMLAKGLR